MTATAHLRPKRRTRARFSKVASARDTIAGFGPDMDVAGLTYGQFSLIDLIQAALEITGPADVTISTWSAGFYDVEAAEKFRANGMLRSIRFVMDAASMKRGQASVADIADLFGPEAIRSTRTHAKFALVRNEAWDVVITSSMNLNLVAPLADLVLRCPLQPHSRMLDRQTLRVGHNQALASDPRLTITQHSHLTAIRLKRRTLDRVRTVAIGRDDL